MDAQGEARVSPLRHWVSTNTSLPKWVEPPKPQAAAPQKRKMDPIYRFGPRAKPIHFRGAVYTTWNEACNATGLSRSALRWEIGGRTKVKKAA